MAKKTQETPAANDKPQKKTVCPITREQFLKAATPQTIKIGEFSFAATPKEFSTGSLGWNLNEKLTVPIDGVLCKVQVGLNITVVGSKEAK